MMQPIINEWQLDTKLNQALQQQHRADFALWLAVLSPAVDEMAAFYTPSPRLEPLQHDLYQQLAVRKSRDFAWQPDDAAKMQQHSMAVQHSLAQLKLQSALNPEPWVWQDSAKKLANEVFSNLDHHCRRRLQGAMIEVPVTDETALYDILQQLESTYPEGVHETQEVYQ